MRRQLFQVLIQLTFVSDPLEKMFQILTTLLLEMQLSMVSGERKLPFNSTSRTNAANTTMTSIQGASAPPAVLACISKSVWTLCFATSDRRHCVLSEHRTDVHHFHNQASLKHSVLTAEVSSINYQAQL